ncbi:hypothetical protein EJB05_32888, partial [Eragrostis curvula]
MPTTRSSSIPISKNTNSTTCRVCTGGNLLQEVVKAEQELIELQKDLLCYFLPACHDLEDDQNCKGSLLWHVLY